MKTGLKQIRSILTQGTVFALPVGKDMHSYGIVLRVGKWPLLMGAFLVDRFTDSVELSEIIAAFHPRTTWITMMGPVGFARGTWRVIGTAAVPEWLLPLPVFRGGSGQVIEMETHSFQPKLVRRALSNDIVIEDSLPGDQAIEIILESKLSGKYLKP